MNAVIHFEANPDLSVPWPIGVDDSLRVTSGLGPDDGAQLIGFTEPGTQSVGVLAERAVSDPTSVIGLHPVFSNAEGFFSWQCAVTRMVVTE